jgi:protein PET100
MGSWRLEIGKMALYITFPVALFHYFNQPELFEDWVVKTKRELYPPEDTPEQRQFLTAIQKIKTQQEADGLKALEKNATN